MTRKLATVLVLTIVTPAFARESQKLPPGVTLPPGFKMPTPTPNDTLVSPKVTGNTVIFHVYAPDAKSVTVEGELFDFGQNLTLTKASSGVWSGQAPGTPSGTYRYLYRIDGVDTVDPRNTQSSRSQTRVQSLVHVPGAVFEDELNVPHGVVGEISYKSPIFATPRRMHVYTPPGYSTSKGPYPVLYLLHGGGDSDDGWPSIGRAGFILDNLIAAGRAKPMIVVMPAGHVPAASGSIDSAGNAMSADPVNDPFTKDLLDTIIPFVEANYAASRRPVDRALAGLSMGGIQAANIGLTHSELFPWLGIFSSGWFPDTRSEFEARFSRDLAKAATNERLLWVGYGKTDIANQNAKAMLEMFRRHGLKYQEVESEGGHTWYNWRHYLALFVPYLFRS